MSDFRLSKQVVLAVNQQALGVPAQAVTKYKTRLMLLNRLGFPAGVNAGRGYRGGYSIDQFWQTVLAFRLMKLGISLGRIVKMINESWDLAYSAVAHSLPNSSFADFHYWWLIEPAGLEDLQLETKRTIYEAELSAARPIETAALAPGVALQHYAASRLLSEFLAIDAKRVVENVLSAFASPELQIDQEELDGEMRRWAAAPAERFKALAPGRS